MFFGEYKHSLDEKGRLRIPVKLRNNLCNGYVVTKGSNGCLFVFDKKYFSEEFLNKLSNVPTFNADSQKPVRLLLSSTFEVEEDAQGRFILPSNLKEFAGISKNITIVGVGSRIEIWDEAKWTAYTSSESFDDVIKNLNSYNV